MSSDRLSVLVYLRRKAAKGAGIFKSNPDNEIANAKNQTSSKRAAGGSDGPSGGDSIKVSGSHASLPASSGVDDSSDTSEHIDTPRQDRPVGDGRELDQHASWREVARNNHALEGADHA